VTNLKRRQIKATQREKQETGQNGGAINSSAQRPPVPFLCSRYKPHNPRSKKFIAHATYGIGYGESEEGTKELFVRDVQENGFAKAEST